MPEEINKMEVIKTAAVDVKAAEATSTSVAKAEPSMAEYAKMREAEARGEEYKPASTEATAAATEESAAATETKADDKPAGEEDPLTQIEETHVAKKGIAKRMGELTAERDAEKAKVATAAAEAEKAKQEAKAAQDELAKLKQEAEARAAIKVPEAKDDPLPDRETFNDPDDYNLAIAQYAARQELRKASESAAAAEKERQEAAKAESEKARIEAVNAQVVELHKGFHERVTTAKTDYPDFDEKVTNNEKLVVRNDVFFEIERSEMAPHILYHLANNPDEVKNLNQLAPRDVIRRMAVLELELKSERKPKPSKAAAPIKPVGSRTSPDRKTPDEESMAEYADRVNREEQQAKAARKGARH